MRRLLLVILLISFAAGCQVANPSQQPALVSTPTAQTRPSATASPQPSPTATSTPTATVQDAEEITDAAVESQAAETSTNDNHTVDSMITETAVTPIPLSGDITQAAAELSGLAWYGDWLILMPQYPDFGSADGDGRLFALSRQHLLDYIEGTIAGPLTLIEVPVEAPGLRQSIPGFEGFEAIIFDGDRAYLAIEARSGTAMTGYLVSAEIAPDLSRLAVNTANLVPLPSASGLSNKSDETLLWTGDQLLTIHEANGVAVNEEPVAQRFDAGLHSLPPLPFPAVEYRITDATEIDEHGRFWAINYFYPGEPAMKPETDPLVEVYGQGASHAAREGVERLLQFQHTESGITLVDRPPLILELLPDQLRNWEGIVRLEDYGFLLVTDRFPETILGLVPHHE